MNAAQLKASILQQAIEGKLVPQLAEEGVAEQIGDAPSEVPYEIPTSWKWVKINSICKLQAGKFIKASEICESGTYPCYGANGVRGSVEIYNYDGEYILIGRVGAQCGNIHVTNGKMYVTDNAIVVDFNKSLIDQKLLALFLKAFNLRKLATATAQPLLTSKRIEKLILPLPPFEEQKRIVAKIEELMPLVEEYGKAYDKLQELNDELPDKLKASILQEAIQGKLVPQLPEDGVIEQIGEAQAEVPFEIPASWKWVTLDNCVFVNPKITQREDEIQATFLPMASVSAGFVNQYSIADKRPWGKIKNGFTRFENNDVLMAKITPCFQNRKSCIVTNLALCVYNVVSAKICNF